MGSEELDITLTSLKSNFLQQYTHIPINADLETMKLL